MIPSPYEGVRHLVLSDVSVERERQISHYGIRSHQDMRDWICILAEEVGELALEVQNLSEASSAERELHARRLYVEAVQVAAVAVAIAERFAPGVDDGP